MGFVQTNTKSNQFCFTGSSGEPKERILPKGCIAIDSGSSCNIFGEIGLLVNIKNTNKEMVLHGNGGVISTNKMGVYDGVYAWYNPDCIANILSLSLLAKQKRIVMDSSQDNALKVEWTPGEWRVFRGTQSGLYVYSPSEDNNVKKVFLTRFFNAQRGSTLYLTLRVP